jgi:hypothetical protein
MHRYLDQVMRVASERASVYKVFAEVIHLLKPPTAFFQPSILAQVLGLAVNRHSNATSPAQGQTITKPLS